MDLARLFWADLTLALILYISDSYPLIYELAEFMVPATCDLWFWAACRSALNLAKSALSALMSTVWALRPLIWLWM